MKKIEPKEEEVIVLTLKDLKAHFGHDVHMSRYGEKDSKGRMSVKNTQNVAIECEDCFVILGSIDL